MSSETSSPFFSSPGTSALLRRLVQQLDATSAPAMEPVGVVQHLVQILNWMISLPEQFDQNTSANIDWIGRMFSDEARNFVELPPEKRPNAVLALFAMAYRFLCELEFLQTGEPSFELRQVVNFVHENIDRFPGTERQQLIYASYTMPARIAKRLIGDPSIIEFRRFSETVESSRKLREDWDSDFSKRQSLLSSLSENITKLSSDYNFVGLVHGFQQLRGSKVRERHVAFGSLLSIAMAMIGVPIGQLCFVLVNLETIDLHRMTLMYSLPAVLTVEIVLLYLFRVVLGQFRSVKAQLLQLDLRIALCQFVENYAEYVSKLRSKDSSALSKFEALIFSGLVTGEADIPSTFDGAEQIASLIRSVRSP